MDLMLIDMCVNSTCEELEDEMFATVPPILYGEERRSEFTILKYVVIIIKINLAQKRNS